MNGSTEFKLPDESIEVYRIPKERIKEIDGIKYVTLEDAGAAFLAGVKEARRKALKERNDVTN